MGLKPTLKPSTNDQRQTTCKLCRHGIFDGQDRVWCTSPLGLVHTECLAAEIRDLLRS